MSEAFDRLCRALAKMPGMGKKSAHRAAVHLALDADAAAELAVALDDARRLLSSCPVCRSLSEEGRPCAICDDESRNRAAICIVESVSDMDAIEKSGAWRGLYHVLGGKLSPIKNVGPQNLNMAELEERLRGGEVKEMILALSNDIEGEATCHYISQKIAEPFGVKLARIGFGLPSGSQLGFADIGTIKSALDFRRIF